MPTLILEDIGPLGRQLAKFTVAPCDERPVHGCADRNSAPEDEQNPEESGKRDACSAPSVTKRAKIFYIVGIDTKG